MVVEGEYDGDFVGLLLDIGINVGVEVGEFVVSEEEGSPESKMEGTSVTFTDSWLPSS